MFASFPDELNTFYVYFENNFLAEEVNKGSGPLLLIYRVAVCRSFKRVNSRKKPGPDDILG